MIAPFSRLFIGLAGGFLAVAAPVLAENIVFPPDAGVINVKERYGVAGDGKTDDTAALQRAIDETKGKPNTLYFPNGTYVVSNTLSEGGKPHSADRFLSYQGQSEAGTIIKLADRSPGFTERAAPKVVLSLYDGTGTGDAMRGYVRNLTLDVGKGNPGAVGLRFLANNTGGMWNVTIVSSDPQRAGKIGLDLRQGQQGPELFKQVHVMGFDHGVETGDSFALVFEHLTLEGQNVLGFLNTARTTIRDLVSSNRVPAFKNGKGGACVTLIEGHLTGGDSGASAIVTETRGIFVRDLQQRGYGHMVQAANGKFIGDATVPEWFDGTAQTLFPAEAKSLRLPIKETPAVPWESDLAQWVPVDSTAHDCTEALQRAIDDAARSGKTTIYFPRAPEKKYLITGPIRVHGSVRRIIGMENIVDIADPAGQFKAGTPVFTFASSLGDTVVVERFFLLGGWKGPADAFLFASDSPKPIVVQNLGCSGIFKKPGQGEWFLEDVVTSRASTLFIGPGEKCWARQLNTETPKADMIEVDGGQLWLLGLKTEGRATHLVAKNGAHAEVLGGVSYQSWGNQPLDPPMFKVADSDVSVSLGFYSYKDPFSIYVEETSGGETRTLARLGANYLPLYRSAGPKR